MQFKVIISKFAQKQVRKLPMHIQNSLRTWSELIEEHGIWIMRRIPGYHDEPLKGKREGQRSSKLSKGYRVIYEEFSDGEIEIINVMEVNKHDY